MMNLLIIRRESDPIEATLALWWDLAFPPGLTPPADVLVTELRGVAASPGAVQAALAEPGDVVLYFGHGTETALGLWPTLIDTLTMSNAHGQVMIAIACRSADTLGPRAVAAGNFSEYLGFSDGSCDVVVGG